MSADGGGHWLDTGDGPVRIDPPAGRAEMNPVVIAYRAYRDHRSDCTECALSILGCPAAGELWTGYTDVRGTS